MPGERATKVKITEGCYIGLDQTKVPSIVKTFNAVNLTQIISNLFCKETKDNKEVLAVFNKC